MQNHAAGKKAAVRSYEKAGIQLSGMIVLSVGMLCGIFQKEVFKGPGPRINSYLDEFDAVAEDIRAGRLESKMVPLQATSDVMHILDRVRKQIGLEYTELE